MSEKDPITEALDEANKELEENRLQSERLKKLSEGISQEIEDNKAQRANIERKLDQIYFQIRQKNLS
jgi:predicted  nucleic acid-binding Zn-ribbon protein